MLSLMVYTTICNRMTETSENLLASTSVSNSDTPSQLLIDPSNSHKPKEGNLRAGLF